MYCNYVLIFSLSILWTPGRQRHILINLLVWSRYVVNYFNRTWAQKSYSKMYIMCFWPFHWVFLISFPTYLSSAHSTQLPWSCFSNKITPSSLMTYDFTYCLSFFFFYCLEYPFPICLHVSFYHSFRYVHMSLCQKNFSEDLIY